MNILKKITAYILLVALIISFASLSVAASRYNDVDDSQYYADAIETLSAYGIVSGFAGNFNPGAHVTRAEFAKMVTLVSGLEDEAYSNAAKRRFDDVSASHWGNGYINAAAENKLIVGYPNGLFMPEKKVTLAESVTVLLRAMDYTALDLGDNWPYAYMVKAKSLGITDGINIGDNSYITRGDLAVVMNRALQSKLNNATEKLISKMDIKMTDEVLIVATKNEDASLKTDEIKTDAGIYKLAATGLKFTPFTKVELALNDDGKVINFNTTYTPKIAVTTIDSFVDGVVYLENGASSRSLGVTDSTTVYIDGNLTTYGNAKSGIEEGAAVSVVYDESGSASYLVFGAANYTQGVAIRSNIYSALESVGVSREQVDSATVIRNGEAASILDAQLYDVAYYLKDNSTIYLYSDKISGVYNEAYPNKANVTSVDISGNILELETQSAVYKLGEKSGSYKLKSKVTALLGKDGKIVDVVDLNAASNSNYGILLSYGTEMSDDMLESGKQYKFITVINGEGNTSKYKTTGDYSTRIGDVGKLSFDEDGNAVFASISTAGAKVSGKIDKNNRKIGDHWLASNCTILERVYTPDTRTGTAIAKEIGLEDFEKPELKASQVVYAAVSGDFGDISFLVVENVTKEQYTYGILTSSNVSVTSSNASGSYTVFANGQSNTYSTSFASNIKTGSAVGMVLDGNKLVSLRALVSVKSAGRLSAIDFTRVKVGNDIYPLADKVQIVKKNSSGKGYIGMALSDADELIGKTVSIYADSAVSNGGLIRVIVVN